MQLAPMENPIVRPKLVCAQFISCCAAICLSTSVDAAAVFTSTHVLAVSEGLACDGATTSSCGLVFSNDLGSGSVNGHADATASFGSAGVSAHFEANNLLLSCCSQYEAEGVAEWVERYIVPSNVHYLDFVYQVAGSSFATGAATAFGTINVFVNNGGPSLTENLRGDETGTFVFRIPREFNIFSDVFSQPIFTQFRARALASGFYGDYVTGAANADYLHTLNLEAINLYGSDGQITDVPSITGESGSTYRVGGYIAPSRGVPEPSIHLLILSGLALLCLVVGRWQTGIKGARRVGWIRVIALLATPVVAKAGFVGRTVGAEAIFPTLSSPVGLAQHELVGGAVEFPQGAFTQYDPLVSIDFSDASIEYILTRPNTTYTSAAFNGFRFFDLNDTVADIIGVSIDAKTSLPGFDATRVSFNSNEILVNFSGLDASGLSSHRILLHVNFVDASIPEPGVLLLLGAGIAGQVFVRRVRVVKSGRISQSIRPLWVNGIFRPVP